MLVKVRLEGEGLAAAGAGERLCAGVGLHMGTKVGFVGKGLLADVAAERLLS